MLSARKCCRGIEFTWQNEAADGGVPSLAGDAGFARGWLILLKVPADVIWALTLIGYPFGACALT